MLHITNSKLSLPVFCIRRVYKNQLRKEIRIRYSMDFNLKQWKEQHESEDQQQQQTAKLPRLLFHSNPHSHTDTHSESQALPLFVTETPTKLPPYSTPPDSVSRYASPGMGGSYFSSAQWQELEVQALIFRHMLSGAAVPAELLHLVKKSLFTNSAHHPYYFSHLHSSPPLSMQSGYWGRAAMDPEPGRCRRTDGKKWRCSRDVVGAGKYCDRHMHRGKNRSRKPVENAAAAGGSGGGMLRATSSSSTAAAAGGGGGGGAASHFAFSNGLSPSVDQLQLNQRSSGRPRQNNEEAKSGQVLRHFFDDWPRPPPQQNDSASTNLSISFSGNNPTSDFSLKLSTGDEAGLDRNRSNWPAQWGSTSHVSSHSMGGPLAEALRSSTSTSSPTSVLHQLQRGCSASELTS